MNRYLKNLNKIEFVVTDACTGRCKHCSEGNHSLHGSRIDPSLAEDAVRRISAKYDIKTVMSFACILFMIFGFIMAKRYVLTKEKNAKIEKYLGMQREGRLGELTDDEVLDLETLKASLK